MNFLSALIRCVGLLDKISIKIDLLKVRLERIEGKIDQLLKVSKPKLTINGGDLMFVVKDDNPDVAYHISPAVAVDAEGNAIPAASIAIEFASDAPDVVAINPTDDLNGSIHFGNPGQANLTLNVKINGEIKKTGASAFTVTTGDPASIQGAEVTFDGLTES